MKILHTSDWHLGRSLYGRKRYEEFARFLDWLANLMQQAHTDALLVAGDVFDTSTPSNRAQELYYGFLCRVAGSSCRHVVVIGGNHDSPSFLNAPKELLRSLNVHVVGSMTPSPADEVIVLRGQDDRPEAIVCAVPYLRDKDLRTALPGETPEDKALKLLDAIARHYAHVCRIAAQKQKEMGEIPIIAMGHLFAAGGKTVQGDGVRDLYVGSLAQVGLDCFPDSIDYAALGHLHVPQRVGKSEHVRYSGSPIPMGYGEATQQKKVIQVSFDASPPTVEPVPVPCFQRLLRISGSLEDICSRIARLKAEESNAWLEIEYTGGEIVGNLRELMDASIEGTSMEIRRIENKRIIDRVLKQQSETETLDDLDERDVFDRCLDAHDIPLEYRPELVAAYSEILTSLHEHDPNAQ